MYMVPGALAPEARRWTGYAYHRSVLSFSLRGFAVPYGLVQTSVEWPVLGVVVRFYFVASSQPPPAASDDLECHFQPFLWISQIKFGLQTEAEDGDNEEEENSLGFHVSFILAAQTEAPHP